MVQAIYNILLNYVANIIENSSYSSASTIQQQTAQIIAPGPFINCTYKENDLAYCGSVSYKAKDGVRLDSKFQITFAGLFFPYNLRSLC